MGFHIYAAFTALLNRSMAAGLLVIAVLLLRLCLKRAPRRYLCVLWALVALRLLCSFGIGSPVSAYNLLQFGTDEAGHVTYFQYNGKTEKPALEFEIPALVNDNASPDSVTFGTHTSGFYLPTVMGIWLFGVAVMASYALIGYLELRKKVSASVLLDDHCRICDEIASPFILGIVRPQIYLPSGMAEETRRHVIAHESAHLRRRDHWWKPLGYVLLTAHWFNPLIWAAYLLFCRDVESACDEKVISGMEREEIAAYAEALLACASRRRTITACPVAFGETDVKKRVSHVLQYRKPAIRIVCAAIVACIAAAVCFLTNPGTQIADTPSVTVVRATVLEIDGGSMIVTPVEGSWELGSSDRFCVPMENMEPSPEPEVGDLVEIEYSGGIEETYPAFLENVTRIRVPDADERVSAGGDTGLSIIIDGVTYRDTGREVPVEPDESAIEYAELPANSSGTGITAFAVLEQGEMIVCLVGDEWHEFAAQ